MKPYSIPGIMLSFPPSSVFENFNESFVSDSGFLLAFGF